MGFCFSHNHDFSVKKPSRSILAHYFSLHVSPTQLTATCTQSATTGKSRAVDRDHRTATTTVQLAYPGPQLAQFEDNFVKQPVNTVCWSMGM